MLTPEWRQEFTMAAEEIVSRMLVCIKKEQNLKLKIGQAYKEPGKGNKGPQSKPAIFRCLRIEFFFNKLTKTKRL